MIAYKFIKIIFGRIIKFSNSAEEFSQIQEEALAALGGSVRNFKVPESDLLV